MSGIITGTHNGPVPDDDKPGSPPGSQDATRSADQTVTQAAPPSLPSPLSSGPPPGQHAPEPTPDPLTPADQVNQKEGGKAARGTTIALSVALVLVVVMTGVLSAVAVLMTRNPDAPPLSQVPVHRLQTPLHFARVTGVRAAPCSGVGAVPDDKGEKCYQLDPGVQLTTVQAIEKVAEQDGTYSIRVVLSPASREQIAELTRETVREQMAIVVGDKVVAAPRVAQEITQDSLSIAGFTSEQADALLAQLGISAAPAGPTGPATDPATGPGPTTGPGPITGPDSGTAPAPAAPGSGTGPNPAAPGPAGPGLGTNPGPAGQQAPAPESGPAEAGGRAGFRADRDATQTG